MPLVPAQHDPEMLPGLYGYHLFEGEISLMIVVEKGCRFPSMRLLFLVCCWFGT